MRYIQIIHHIIFISIAIIEFSFLNLNAQTLVTAKCLLNQIDSLVFTIDNAKLVSIETDSMDYLGKSDNWNYYYLSLTKPSEFWISTIGNNIYFKAEYTARDGICVLPTNFIDSDAAVKILEDQNGIQLINTKKYKARLFHNELPNISETYWEIMNILVNAESNSTSIKYVESNDYPKTLILYPNYPNPFNSSTTIKYYIQTKAAVNISIFDIQGRLIELIESKIQEMDYNEVVWKPSNIPSGLYIFKISSDKQCQMQKVLYLK